MTTTTTTTCFSFPLYSCLLLLLSCLSLSFSRSTEPNGDIPIKGIDIRNPVSHLIPSPLLEHSSTPGAKDIVSCDRVRVSGLSRLIFKSYASSFRVTFTPSIVIPERFHGKIEVCFHRNSSLGLCQCSKDEWRAFQKGNWSTVMSPYEDRYFDVKFIDGISGSITVLVAEEFHQWRMFCLGFGFVLLLLAPIFSNWVPFYYSSSMAIGILLVILVILFQGMKLLPTGRKNAFYLSIYGSVLGVGSFLFHYFSVMINSILLNFGLNEEMHNPLSVLVLVGVVLVGAALGYWIVHKFVMSEDGRVDVGVAHFVKWAMRIVAITSIFQSTLDTPLGLLASGSCWAICFALTSLRWQGPRSMSGGRPSRKTSWISPKRSFAWSDSPSKGLLTLPSSNEHQNQSHDYYSTFHKTSNHKRYSKREWDDFTRESTRQAMTEWASSPEFTDWLVENADRIRLAPGSDDDTMSCSDFSEETSVENGSGVSFLKWR